MLEKNLNFLPFLKMIRFGRCSAKMLGQTMFYVLTLGNVFDAKSSVYRLLIFTSIYVRFGVSLFCNSFIHFLNVRHSILCVWTGLDLWHYCSAPMYNSSTNFITNFTSEEFF